MSTRTAGLDHRLRADSLRGAAEASEKLGRRRRHCAPLSADVRAAIRFIDENLQEKLTVGWLADVAGTSRVEFARRFKAFTGMSPYRFVLARRFRRAQQLLLSSALPLGEVAYAVGYSSQSHMTSVFQRDAGMTPKEYRRAFGQNQ